ncbi:DUF881 domain-containing protein [Microlunatus speluncae]|uniref:DUF881 domain-containing protein n=1 Tax=Microlunatus speluncae TaxID=2594267 RepID=UPI00126665CC|nr:DUF881 domain-containing protein [Microlunatus speluncae]
MAVRRSLGEVLRRVTRVLHRAQTRQQITGPGRLLGRTATTVLCLLAGLMVVIGALNARGTDLRPGRNTDLVSLVQSQSRHNTDLAHQVTDLRREVDRLTEEETGVDPERTAELDRQSDAAGISAVHGPAVSVTLDDAPESVAAEGVDGDLLVVHQQDIQAIVNLLWQSGAEAMTIQGQRVISTTGVKCVGNTVVLHGIPYAPPYVIKAIGDRGRLESGLATSEFVTVFQRYVDAYGMVYQTGFEADAQFPAYHGSMELRHARSLAGGPSETPGNR